MIYLWLVVLFCAFAGSILLRQKRVPRYREYKRSISSQSLAVVRASPLKKKEFST